MENNITLRSKLSDSDHSLVLILTKDLSIISMNKNCQVFHKYYTDEEKNYISHCKKAKIAPILTEYPKEMYTSFIKTYTSEKYIFDILPWNEDSILIVGYNANESESLRIDLINKVKKITGSKPNKHDFNSLFSQIIMFYEYLLFNMPGNVYWLDKNYKMLGCNKNILDFLGLSTLDEFIGKTYQELADIANWQEGLAESFQKDDTLVLEGGQPIISKNEPPIYMPDGSTVYYVTSRVPININRQITGLMGISVDVTDLKETKAQLENSLEEIEEAIKIRDKTLDRYKQFVSDQEHDIRTPLGNLASCSEYLLSAIKSRYTLDDELLILLEGVRDSSKEILDYQHSLLLGLRKDNMSDQALCTRFNLREIVKRAFKVNLVSARYHHLDYTLNYDELTSKKYFLGDWKRIYQSLVDLLSNAIRFTNEGTVNFEVDILNHNKNEAIVRFRVTDTGIGIAEEKQDDILEAFVKTKASNKGGVRGRGLGLFRVNQYALDMNGELRFVSKEGKGSCFTLVVPLKVSLDQTDS